MGANYKKVGITRNEVFNILRNAGICRGSRNWGDYEHGKAILTGGGIIDQGDYGILSNYLCQYIEV
jgi:hypothetical protein